MLGENQGFPIYSHCQSSFQHYYYCQIPSQDLAYVTVAFQPKVIAQTVVDYDTAVIFTGDDDILGMLSYTVHTEKAVVAKINVAPLRYVLITQRELSIFTYAKILFMRDHGTSWNIVGRTIDYFLISGHIAYSC